MIKKILFATMLIVNVLHAAGPNPLPNAKLSGSSSMTGTFTFISTSGTTQITSGTGGQFMMRSGTTGAFQPLVSGTSIEFATNSGTAAHLSGTLPGSQVDMSSYAGVIGADAGQIYSDGSGNLTVGSSLTTSYFTVNGNFNLYDGGIYIQGSNYMDGSGIYYPGGSYQPLASVDGLYNINGNRLADADFIYNTSGAAIADSSRTGLMDTVWFSQASGNPSIETTGGGWLDLSGVGSQVTVGQGAGSAQSGFLPVFNDDYQPIGGPFEGTGMIDFYGPNGHTYRIQVIIDP